MASTEPKSGCPRILVVSNNCFSMTQNNGKTLASFFFHYPAESIAQLYFNPEVPTVTRYKRYFRITDIDVIRSLVKKRTQCGRPIATQSVRKRVGYRLFMGIVNRVKKYSVARLGRDLIWRTEKWKSRELDKWLEEFSPDVVFFCAGDSGFAYNVVQYVKEKFASKLVVYVTDDYVLPRRTLSPFWWVQRSLLFDKMKHAVKESDLFYTISPQMRCVYKSLFGVDSSVVMNVTASLKDEKPVEGGNDNIVNLVYAGGLHYKRYEVLGLLGSAIKRYNEGGGHSRRAFLRVYSTQEVNRRILRHLNKEGVSEFCGPLDQHELSSVLNSSDILVHVEAFGRKNIESTRLSISTKISEYLSLGKPILAVGPAEVASIQYLRDCALCVTRPANLEVQIASIIENREFQTELAQKAMGKFLKNHDPNAISTSPVNKIIALYQ